MFNQNLQSFSTSNKLTFFSDLLESYWTKHLKSIFAFTDVDGFDICFFVFFVKESKSYFIILIRNDIWPQYMCCWQSG